MSSLFRWHRWLFVALTASALAVCGLAQTAPESEASSLPPTSEKTRSEKTIRAWLHSGDPRLIAWGAHDAIATRDPYVAPDLLNLADQWRTLSPEGTNESGRPELAPEQKGQRFAMAAVLDALIQVNAKVPADSLRSLAPDFGNSVAVLLSRLPFEESEQLSLELYALPSENGYVLQYVSASLLALHPTAEFVEHLLSNTKVQANIMVVQPGSGAGLGGSGGSCMGTEEKPGENWPSIGQYKLSKEKTDGALQLVAGINPVYAQRVESYGYLGDICSMAWAIYLDGEDRRRLIAEILGVQPEEIPWQSYVRASIEFQSAQQFKLDLRNLVEEEEQKYRATAEALEARDLLAQSQVQQSLPTLRLRLHDMRGDNAEPLPTDILLPPRVEWATGP